MSRTKKTPGINEKNSNAPGGNRNFRTPAA